jgi:UDP-N-acetylmuramate-alanine ligase
VEDIQKRDAALAGHVRYAPDLDQARKMLDDMIKPGDVVLVMGAGDIFEIADQLVQAS